MELDSTVSDKIDGLSEQGNLLLDEQGDWRGAIDVWRTALNLVPEPKTEWEAATWLNASIAEAFFAGGQKEDALVYFMDALNCPDGHMNPFILFRIGQLLVDNHEEARGIEYLLRAYMLDGDDIFQSDGGTYLDLLRRRKLVD